MTEKCGWAGQSLPHPHPTARRPHLKRIFRVSMLAVGVLGCSTSGARPDSPTDPLSWPTGQYYLEGTVTYRNDSEAGTSTDRASYEAELEIRTDGSMTLSSSSGYCQPRSPEEIRVDQQQRQRTFPCNGVSFVLKPMGDKVRGEVRASVSESIRVQGPCRQMGRMDGRPTCLAYSYDIRFRQATRTGTLKVLKRTQ